MDRILTLEEVTVAQKGALQPWVQPTEIQVVPTPEEMAKWQPSGLPEDVRWRTEINVTTGERKWIELTLDEYRARHVAKIVSKNEWLLKSRADAEAAAKKAQLDAFVDALAADPTLLDKIKQVK